MPVAHALFAVLCQIVIAFFPASLQNDYHCQKRGRLPWLHHRWPTPVLHRYGTCFLFSLSLTSPFPFCSGAAKHCIIITHTCTRTHACTHMHSTIGWLERVEVVVIPLLISVISMHVLTHLPARLRASLPPIGGGRQSSRHGWATCRQLHPDHQWP